jgi:hypothetical protein
MAVQSRRPRQAQRVIRSATATAAGELNLGRPAQRRSWASRCAQASWSARSFNSTPV